MSVQELVEAVAAVRNGNHESIQMGEPFRFTEACNASWEGGDAVWQGDMFIKLVDRTLPADYELATQDQLAKMVKCGLGLVPGNDSTEGSRHCLNSLDGVRVFLPSTYEDEGNLLGPILHLTSGCEIKHPTHGDVVVPSCFDAVAIGYQREYDLEQQMERRAKD